MCARLVRKLRMRYFGTCSIGCYRAFKVRAALMPVRGFSRGYSWEVSDRFLIEDAAIRSDKTVITLGDLTYDQKKNLPIVPKTLRPTDP